MTEKSWVSLVEPEFSDGDTVDYWVWKLWGCEVGEELEPVRDFVAGGIAWTCEEAWKAVERAKKVG